MHFNEEINNRLLNMAEQVDPSEIPWPEKCGGSRNALVIFVGPSPGGKKQLKRQDRDQCAVKPLWNTPYNDPLSCSRG